MRLVGSIGGGEGGCCSAHLRRRRQHLITILINRPRRCEREAIIMQMNDDFSTLNCFVSWLC